MMSVVVDTHTLLWYLMNSSQLSKDASKAVKDALNAGYHVYVPSISIVEVVYLTEKGRLPMQALNSLLAALNDNASGFSVVSLDLEVCKSVQSVSREAIPDMPDRIITATAVLLQLPLVTRDKKIADAGFTTIW